MAPPFASAPAGPRRRSLLSRLPGSAAVLPVVTHKRRHGIARRRPGRAEEGDAPGTRKQNPARRASACGEQNGGVTPTRGDRTGNPSARPGRIGDMRMGLPLGRAADETLLAGLTTGDPEIAVAFVRRFQRTVYGVAIAVVGDPQLAEDIAQQTFERAWRHAQMYDSRRGSVKTWLTTIAHDLAIDTVRARRSTPVAPEDLDALLDIVGTEYP